MRYVTLQQSDNKRAEFMKEMGYIRANMIDETGSDRRNICRRYGNHLRGVTLIDFRLTIHGKPLSSVGIMSFRDVEDVDTYEGNVNGDKSCNFVNRCLVPILMVQIIDL